MNFSARVIEDSIGPHNIRLTTLEATFPRFILAELNTHRILSRNSASSRAIPTSRLIEQVTLHPVVPSIFGSNQRGMASGAEIADARQARILWMEARDRAIHAATQLSKLGVHKQWANRVLEPFMWHTAIISATNWSNLLHLRTQDDAQPEFRTLALKIQDALGDSRPVKREPDEWHLPFVSEEERTTLSTLTAACVSAARCARISYNRPLEYDTAKDIELSDRLLVSGHMSPFEHPSVCLIVPARWGNYVGWKQYRKLIPHEEDPLGSRDE